MDIDLNIALRKFHQLQLEDGDLGAEYWGQVARLLQEAALHEERARIAERKLEAIRSLLLR